MKKTLSIILTLAMLLNLCGIVSFAAEPTEVYVTVAKEGEFVATREKVVVTDIDNDNALTINDALFALHEAKFEGGAQAGYNYYTGQYGLSLGKLWGDESGAFGYRVNNVSAMSLADAVANGDTVYAYVYKDQTTWSDAYTWFDKESLEAEKDDEVTLTLTAAGYDAFWNPITTPVENATIKLNGETTNYKTDSEGKVTIVLDKAGTIVISAVSDNQVLVPPVCVATVKETENIDSNIPGNTSEEIPEKNETPEVEPEKDKDTETTPEENENPKNGDSFNLTIAILALMISAVVLTFTYRKNSYEK